MAKADTIKEDKMQERFLNAVQDLGLRFPVAKIVKDTGYNSGIVSEYLNSKKTVSEKFLREFAKVYGLDGNYLVTGQGKPPEQPKEIDILIKTVQSLATSVAEDRTMVKKRFEEVETNLKVHGTALESLLEWKNLADDTFEEIAAQLKPLTDAAFRKAAVSSGGKQKGT